MKTHIDYANEVVLDAMNGVEPNPSVAQRAIADANSLRAVNAELVEALQAVHAGFRDGSIKWAKPRQADNDPYHPANLLMTAALAKAQEGK